MNTRERRWAAGVHCEPRRGTSPERMDRWDLHGGEALIDGGGLACARGPERSARDYAGVFHRRSRLTARLMLAAWAPRGTTDATEVQVEAGLWLVIPAKIRELLAVPSADPMGGLASVDARMPLRVGWQAGAGVEVPDVRTMTVVVSRVAEWAWTLHFLGQSNRRGEAVEGTVFGSPLSVSASPVFGVPWLHESHEAVVRVRAAPDEVHRRLRELAMAGA